MKDFNMHLNLGQGDLPRISAPTSSILDWQNWAELVEETGKLLVAGRNDKMEKRKRMAIWD